MVDDSGYRFDGVVGKQTKRGKRPEIFDGGVGRARQDFRDLFPAELLLYTEDARQDFQRDNRCRFGRRRQWRWLTRGCCDGHVQTGASRKLVWVAATAVATLAIAIPFAEIAKNETAVAVFSETAGVVEHHSEFLIFELPPRFEFVEVDALQRWVFAFKNAHATALLVVDFLQVTIS